jgi:uncharacterized protein DUF4145
MKCPNCNTAVRLNLKTTDAWYEDDPKQGWDLAYDRCPECGRLLVFLRFGQIWVHEPEERYSLVPSTQAELIYPVGISRPLEPEVPEPSRTDFREASAVLSISPRASAALSRRILQSVLREKFKLGPADLVVEIEAFLALPGVPSYLTGAVDAVRHVGNLAAHPTKSKWTGEIAEVEAGEAEWLLDAVEALLDYAFVQPKRLEERRLKLNEKLAELGKPPLK